MKEAICNPRSGIRGPGSGVRGLQLGISNVRGFALIVSLSLMGFIFLLLLSLSSLVHIETKTGDVRLQEQMARNNALIGMKTALGQLQKYAGHDQRVTARADILETHSGSFNFNKGSVVNPYYTLVWDVSGSEGNKPGEEPGHNEKLKPAVLVSGNENINFNIRTSTSYPGGYINEQQDLSTDNDAVWIIGHDESSINYDSELVEVIVKKQPIVSGKGNTGHYAYWVGDEGIKARINLKAPNFDTADEHYSWTTAQRHGLQTIKEFNTLETELLSKAFTLNSLFLVDQQSTLRKEDLAENIHNITAYSQGVITDVKNGRLKQDLTFGLDKENSGSAPSEIKDAEYIFGESNISSPGGKDVQYCQWGVLKDYYNLKTEGTIEGRSHMYGDDNYDVGLNPVITRFQYGIYVNKDTANNAIIYHMPSVVLWNPYNVALHCEDMNLGTKIQIGGIMKIRINGRNHEVKNISCTIREFTIEAGETLIFSPPDHGSGVYDKFVPGSWHVNTSANNNNLLEEGWRSGAAFVEETTLPITGNTVRLQVQNSARRHVSLHYAANVVGNLLQERAASLCNLNGRIGTSGSIPPYTLNGTAGFPGPEILYSYVMSFSDTGYSYSPLPERPIQWAGNFNLRAHVHNRANRQQLVISGVSSNPLAYLGGYLSGTVVNGNYEIPNDNGRAHVGNSSGYGSTRASLFEIQKKDTVLTSLAQLGHAQITGIDTDHPHDDSTYASSGYDATFQSSSCSDQFAPAYAIGSALAPAYMELDETDFESKSSSGSSITNTWDYSYLLNDALFDKYFFSTNHKSV